MSLPPHPIMHAMGGWAKNNDMSGGKHIDPIIALAHGWIIDPQINLNLEVFKNYFHVNGIVTILAVDVVVTAARHNPNTINQFDVGDGGATKHRKPLPPWTTQFRTRLYYKLVLLRANHSSNLRRLISSPSRHQSRLAQPARPTLIYRAYRPPIHSRGQTFGQSISILTSFEGRVLYSLCTLLIPTPHSFFFRW
jgi:hypothetical protein